jgi:hypothetical protein
MASPDDFLTTQKNGVQAINGYTNSLNTHAGTNNVLEVPAASTQLIKSTSGWLATVSVIVAGSTQGYFYDSSNVNQLTGTRIYAIPNTVGIYQIQFPFANGLIIVTGTGSIVSVGYT